MVIGRILAGIALLILGRKLFWLFVGLVGFVFGITLATSFFRGPDWMVLVIALVAGLLGVLLALVLQRVAVAVAGFIAGGYVLISVLSGMGWETGRLYWLFFVAGGIVGAVLVVALFDWALIILSSLTGAALVVQAVQFGPLVTALLFTGLFIVGMVIQGSLMRREQSPPVPPAEA